MKREKYSQERTQLLFVRSSTSIIYAKEVGAGTSRGSHLEQLDGHERC